MRAGLAATWLLLLSMLLAGCAAATSPAQAPFAGGQTPSAPPPTNIPSAAQPTATSSRLAALSERGGRPAPTALPTAIPSQPATALARTGPDAPVLLPSTAPSPTATPTTAPTPVRPASISGNWSGYKALGGNFTAVAGTWTVPWVKSMGSSSSSSTWVGIGGAGYPDLIQAGTQGYFDGAGAVHYEAWIETLPQAMSRVALEVKPGDVVTVVVAQAAGDQWSIKIQNRTSGEEYQTAVQYESSLSSAEWIVEAPSVDGRTLTLVDFGTVRFSGLSVVKEGKAMTIAEAKAEPILLAAQGKVIASPTGFTADGSGFSVTRIPVP
ncbi:MAG: G1 family endopeptidase [Chloroflexi bacterium]|nr:G1 family endopeptidase [Chloroflexota bacterium]